VGVRLQDAFVPKLAYPGVQLQKMMLRKQAVHAEVRLQKMMLLKKVHAGLQKTMLPNPKKMIGLVNGSLMVDETLLDHELKRLEGPQFAKSFFFFAHFRF
jgi:hypothetical protein